MPVNRNLPVTPEFKETLREYAWANRTSMSALAVAAVVSIAEDGIDYQPKPQPVFSAEFKFPVPPEYERALAVAREHGVPLADLIRHKLEQQVGDV